MEALAASELSKAAAQPVAQAVAQPVAQPVAQHVATFAEPQKQQASETPRRFASADEAIRSGLEMARQRRAVGARLYDAPVGADPQLGACCWRSDCRTDLGAEAAAVHNVRHATPRPAGRDEGAQLNEMLRKLEGQVRQLETQKETQVRQLEAQVQKVEAQKTAQVRQLQSQVQKLEAQKTAQVQKLEAQVQKLEAQKTAQVRQLQSQVRSLEAQKKELAMTQAAAAEPAAQSVAPRRVRKVDASVRKAQNYFLRR